MAKNLPFGLLYFNEQQESQASCEHLMSHTSSTVREDFDIFSEQRTP